jgi:hypothetical protein
MNFRRIAKKPEDTHPPRAPAAMQFGAANIHLERRSR